MRHVTTFILGSQKCGTTSLAAHLAGHPDVFVPSIKETYFFCDEARFAAGVDAFHREFYSAAAARKARLWCDATPFHLASRTAIDRIAAYAPATARFVVILRDPVARAYSAYLHQKRLGNEAETFARALDLEPARVAAARAEGGRWWRHAYVEVGQYADQLEHAYKMLGRDRVLVLDSSALRDGAGTSARLIDHLGLTAPFADSTIPHANEAATHRSGAVGRLVTGRNPLKSLARRIVPRELRTRVGRGILRANSQPIAKQPMPADCAERLRDAFAPDIARLESLGVPGARQWAAAQSRAPQVEGA